MEAAVGWLVLAVVLASPAAVLLEILLAVARLARLHIRLQPLVRATVVSCGAIALWYILPFLIHSLLNPTVRSANATAYTSRP